MKAPVESKDFFGQTFTVGDHVVCLAPRGYRSLVVAKVHSNANKMSKVVAQHPNIGDRLSIFNVDNGSCIRIAPDNPEALAYEKMAEGKKIL